MQPGVPGARTPDAMVCYPVWTGRELQRAFRGTFLEQQTADVADDDSDSPHPFQESDR